MQIINYIFILALILSGVISMFPKYHKLGLKLLKYVLFTFILLKFTPVIYSYIDGFVK